MDSGECATSKRLFHARWLASICQAMHTRSTCQPNICQFKDSLCVFFSPFIFDLALVVYLHICKSTPFCRMGRQQRRT